MNKIEKLLKELCPNGVEFKALGEVGSFFNGLSGKNKDDFKNGNAKYVTYLNVFNNIATDLDKTEFVQVSKDEKQNILKKGDVLFTLSSESLEECGMSSVIVNDILEPIYLNSFCFGFRFNNIPILPDFSKYLFRDDRIRKQIYKTANGVTRFNISRTKFEKIQIPIPPLEVQEEIVKILDTFTELERELERELESHIKQYEYYRNKLLSLEYLESSGGYELKTLGEICEARRGSFPQPYGDTRWYGGIESMPFVQTADIGKNMQLSNYTKSTISKIAQPKSIFCPKNSVIVSLQGVQLGRVAITQYDCYIDRTIAVFQNYKIDINKKYFAYQLYNAFQFKRSKARGATIPTITKEEFKAFQIPIPPLATQEKIVSILDKFHALTTDLTSGIPAELEARKKQYEYYRNKLLTFKEAR